MRIKKQFLTIFPPWQLSQHIIIIITISIIVYHLIQFKINCSIYSMTQNNGFGFGRLLCTQSFKFLTFQNFFSSILNNTTNRLSKTTFNPLIIITISIIVYHLIQSKINCSIYSMTQNNGFGFGRLLCTQSFKFLTFQNFFSSILNNTTYRLSKTTFNPLMTIRYICTGLLSWVIQKKIKHLFQISQV